MSDAAIAALERELARTPRDPAVRAKLARALHRSARDAEAWRVLREHPGYDRAQDVMVQGSRGRCTFHVLDWLGHGASPGTVKLDAARGVVYGRHSEAELRLEDYRVARRHGRVAYEPPGQFLLIDYGSANGTFLNLRRVEAHPVVLADGDELHVGNARILFRVGWEEEGERVESLLNLIEGNEAPRVT